MVVVAEVIIIMVVTAASAAAAVVELEAQLVELDLIMDLQVVVVA